MTRQTPARPPTAETAAVHNLENRQGAGVLMVCSATGRMLLGLRGMDCSAPETWCPFGGMVELNEEPFAAAYRELQEEAGIQVNMAQVNAQPLYVDSSQLGFEFYTYLCILNYEPNVRINDESSGFGWFAPGQTPSRMHPGFAAMLQDTKVKAVLEKMALVHQAKHLSLKQERTARDAKVQ